MPSDRSQVYIPREHWSPELERVMPQEDPALGAAPPDENTLLALHRLRGTWRETVPAGLVNAALEGAQRLWPDGAPGAPEGAAGWRHTPTLYPVLPDPAKAQGAAMVVVPGGGYRTLAPWEGLPIGEWFAERGVAAFVLQYRLLPYTQPAALDDVQRALRTVRAGASGWGIDPTRVGVIGFSAGGHLAALASTLWDEADPLQADDIARQSARPDLAVLFYPAISLLQMRALAVLCLGTEEPGPALLARYSAERQVRADAAPAFLLGSVTDQIIAPGHLTAYAEALGRAGVPYELHLYGSGVHGTGIYDPRPTHRTWEPLLEHWLRERGLTR